MSEIPDHPAEWHDDALQVIARLLNRHAQHHTLPSRYEQLHLLDPMAGKGKILDLGDGAWLHDPRWRLHASELEPEWCAADHRIRRAEASDELARCARWPLTAIVYSPPFGNRMADTYLPPPTDTSVRHTYTVALGRPPTPGSAAALYWGGEYRGAMWKIYRSTAEAAGDSTLVIVEIADHVEDGRLVNVTDWTRWALQQAGLRWIGDEIWRTRPVRYDQSSHRVHDRLLCFRGHQRPGAAIL